MPFQIRRNKKGAERVYKTLYLSKTLVARINRIACDNGTSFNNAVISMIESCLNEEQN